MGNNSHSDFVQLLKDDYSLPDYYRYLSKNVFKSVLQLAFSTITSRCPVSKSE